MAAIDKIYLNYSDAKDFVEWVRKHDEEFRKEFTGSKCHSIMDFFYFSDVDEWYKDCDKDACPPVCNIPEMVERWIMWHDDLPEATLKEMHGNYAYDSKTKEEWDEWLYAPLEQQDPRPIGKHAKIISRTGWFEGRNDGRIEIGEHSRWYYKMEYCKKHNIPYMEYPYECEEHKGYIEDLIGDMYWYCWETENIENCWYPKKKNICCTKCSSLERKGTKSVRAAIRQILKSGVFPVGTIIRIQEFRYEGEILLKITK